MAAVAEREFGWSDETARNFVRVSEAFGAKFQPGWDLPIDTSALYLLAAPRVPEALRVEAVERAEAGERIAGCTDPWPSALVDQIVDRPGIRQHSCRNRLQPRLGGGG